MDAICINELKKLELDILNFVADFCEEKGITYFLCGGTMLGAVRHNGFIPWDDDIDIMLLREDYERLLAEFPEHDYYKIIDNRKCKDYPFAYATINDTRTYKKEKKLRTRFTRNLCVNVDVFPIDTLPEDENERELYYKKIAKQGLKLQCAIDCYGKGVGFGGTVIKFFAITFFRILEFCRVIKAEDVVEQFRNLSQIYNNVKSPYCGITSIAHYGTKEVNLRENYKILKHEFEKRDFNIINGYDAYLRQLYGDDYMKLPPKGKQNTHHVSNCFWRNE